MVVAGAIIVQPLPCELCGQAVVCPALALQGQGSKCGHGEGGDAELGFDQAVEHVGVVGAQVMAVPTIDIRKQGGIIERGAIFEGGKLHRLAGLGLRKLFRDQHAYHGHAASHGLRQLCAW